VIVPDASVVFAALLDRGGGGALARTRLGRDARHGPYLIDVEVASAIRGRVLGGELDPRVAREAIADLTVLPVVRHDHRPLLSRVWELRDNVTCYDAVYLALAEAFGATFVTADERLESVPGIRCEVEVLRP
jgi:predicted nucleic acid-binding protein